MTFGAGPGHPGQEARAQRSPRLPWGKETQFQGKLEPCSHKRDYSDTSHEQNNRERLTIERVRSQGAESEDSGGSGISWRVSPGPCEECHIYRTRGRTS